MQSDRREEITAKEIVRGIMRVARTMTKPRKLLITKNVLETEEDFNDKRAEVVGGISKQ
jgi:hypothetical protein